MKAADQGELVCQYSLGLLYTKGDGVTKNYVKAHQWFSLVSAQGDEGAKKDLLTIEKQMTSEQIAEAQFPAGFPGIRAGGVGQAQRTIDDRNIPINRFPIFLSSMFLSSLPRCELLVGSAG